MRHLFIIGCFALVAACKPHMSADVYAGDILEVAETGKLLEMPVRMGLPIQDEKKCGENKDKMLPALQKYGKGVKFLSCKDVKGEMFDLLIVELTAEIVKAPESGVATLEGMFGVSVTQSNDGSLVVNFIKTDNVDKAVKEIDKNYQFQNVVLEDIELKIRFNNDLRKTIKYEIEGSFVNDNPVDAPSIFELKRRGMIEIVPSNVKSQSMIKTGNARFARLIL